MVHELERLARADDRLVASPAQRALSVLDDCSSPPLPEKVQPSDGSVKIVSARPPSDIAYPLDPESVDHQQIALGRDHIEDPGICAVVTCDKEIADIAASASPSVPTVIINPREGMEAALRE